MRTWRTVIVVLACALAALALGQPARYSTKSNRINVGTLLLDSQGLANPAPHAWFTAERDTVVKPADWILVNPTAPPPDHSAV